MDAICVFDADNVVDPGFLSAMNHAWCAGARAAQGYRDSKNPHDTVISGNYSIYYWMVNRFYSHARNAVGLSAIVNGSGFMADLGLLREMGGWNTLTLTEDIEFTTKCILRDVRVEWVPQAVTYDEQPLTFAQSWRQRAAGRPACTSACRIISARSCAACSPPGCMGSAPVSTRRCSCSRPSSRFSGWFR